MPSRRSLAVVTLTCTNCGVVFTRCQSHSHARRGAFCSAACHWEYWRASRPRAATCQQCGKQFPAKPHKIERGEAKFCGQKCYRLSCQRDLADYFWSQVDKSGEHWLWRGPINSGNGYGRFSFQGKELYAHRVAYELTNGPLPPGKNACHSCDIPLCMRPDHLFAGTHLENMLDRDAKGRVAHGDQSGARLHPELYRGEHIASSKLVAAQIAAIREAYAAGGITQRELANRYGLDQSSVSNIVRGKRWRHLL